MPRVVQSTHRASSKAWRVSSEGGRASCNGLKKGRDAKALQAWQRTSEDVEGRLLVSEQDWEAALQLQERRDVVGRRHQVCSRQRHERLVLQDQVLQPQQLLRCPPELPGQPSLTSLLQQSRIRDRLI